MQPKKNRTFRKKTPENQKFWEFRILIQKIQKINQKQKIKKNQETHENQKFKNIKF